jgi:nucleotide sugar dehydrogenase
MRFLPNPDGPTAAVIGLGHVGSAVAATLSRRGVRTVGIDTDATRIEELYSRHCRIAEPGLAELLFDSLDSGRLDVCTEYAPASTVDVLVVTVGTPARSDGTLVDTQLADACVQLAKHIRRDQLVVVKSTIPPGTIRTLVVPRLEDSGLKCGEDFGLAFCPERLSEGTALREIGSIPIVVGGWSAESADAAAAFWTKGIGSRIIRCSSVESAELVKLADNWWIDHNIALANELAKVCAAMNVDVLEVISAANSIQKGNGNVNILLPSVGVGGSCLTKDPWMLWRTAQELGVNLRMIPVAREVNDEMPHYTVDVIAAGLADIGKELATARIAVLGLAFKNNTGDLRSTPTVAVVSALRRAGADVAVFDPLVAQDDVEKTFGILPASSVHDAATGADCVAVLARHDELDNLIDFDELRACASSRCVVVDGRAYYPAETIDALRRQGFTYRGIGR